jgi:2'-5' RNA ligase
MTADEILNTKHKEGTYAALKLSKECAEKLANWCDENNIEHDKAKDFHCTICYSKQPVPSAEVLNCLPVSAFAKIDSWENLGPHATVLLITSSKIQQIFDLLKKFCASHDFPKFTPHITINSTKHSTLPEILPNVDIIFDKIVVSPLVD